MSKVNKKIFRYAGLFMITSSFILTFLPTNSYACSCVLPGTPEEELEESMAVFSGKVVKIMDKNKNNLIQSSTDPIAVVLEVEETWKGMDKSEVVVHTERSSASCGYEFSLNKDYIVYANERDGGLHVSLCSRTALLSEADEDIHALGEGEAPKEEVSVDLTNTNNHSVYIYLAVTVVLLVGVYFIIARRSKR
ncbi:hypothetical protein MUO14_17185 [Halobacillus shinanisalinarum]|uniref:Tissue inhibitor of metalloproteinase n=2 Tax=Halobacillus TaxID=45667 RepID=A0ABY4H7Z0_9BACI|nr:MULTISPECIES: hypothetical protein [Halobacillus]UOQ92206.1 hypothetical protein MUO14_17185 [Halobacillus shinanisalinarum]UOR10991.1 hypothetical protein MUO15_15475 [Halobacillus amylolyticus]